MGALNAAEAAQIRPFEVVKRGLQALGPYLKEAERNYEGMRRVSSCSSSSSSIASSSSAAAGKETRNSSRSVPRDREIDSERDREK